MISLRSKIILSLVGTSILAIGLTALLILSLMHAKFDSLVVNRAAQDFIYETQEYYSRYGSWEAAIQSEPFFEFTRQLRTENLALATEALTNNNRPLRDSDLPPPPRTYNGEQTSRQQGNPNQKPPSGPFTLVDTQGMVLLPSLHKNYGDIIPKTELHHAIPVIYQEENVGYVVTEATMTLTGFESHFLTTIKESWWRALIIAFLFALPLGIYLGSRLTAPINRLNKAIGAMHPDNLEQSVHIKHKDELGQLSENFNQMSQQLSLAYKELEESRMQLAEYAEQMREASLQDPLTLLPNRRAFSERAPQLIEHALYNRNTCILALVDIDNFKIINDSYSHSVGDYVLGRLAFIMKSKLRKTDLIARYGGEEFAILFPQTDMQTSFELIEHIRTAMSEYIWKGVDEKLQVTMSAGISEIIHSENIREALNAGLREADTKLYEAKHLGRNRTES